MRYMYQPRNVCSKEIYFDIDENNIISNVKFIGGCEGNLKALMSLYDGMKAEEIIAKTQGITCGNKPTSCPDQFAYALTNVLQKQKEENNA